MYRKALSLSCLCLLALIVSMSSFSFSLFAFAQQTSPTNTGSNASTSSTTQSLGSSQLVQKLEKAPSLSNIVGISMVDGIKVTGIDVGDTDLTITLTYQRPVSNATTTTAATSTGNASSLTGPPVTILVTKLPVKNLTQLISTTESSLRLAQESRNINPMAPLTGLAEPSAAMGSDAIQILELLRDIQIGTASIVNANWTVPQTISMGLLGMGNRVAASAPSDLVLVAVIPFQGESGNLPDVGTLALK